MPFRKIGIFGPQKRQGIKRMTYLQQVSRELEREQARPEHIQLDFMQVGSETILNQVAAEKRGHQVRALYWKFRSWLWSKQAQRAEHKHEQLAELVQKRTTQTKRVGVHKRSGRF